MRIPCPSCGTERTLLGFLWQATSPAGFCCAACQATSRLKTPADTLVVGLVFGVLLAAGYGAFRGVAGPATAAGGATLRVVAVVPIAGLAMLVAHALVIGRRGVVRADRAPPAARYLLAATLSTVLALALLAGTLAYVA